jgi:hypothetical protein
MATNFKSTFLLYRITQYNKFEWHADFLYYEIEKVEGGRGSPVVPKRAKTIDLIFT